MAKSAPRPPRTPKPKPTVKATPPKGAKGVIQSYSR